MVNLGSRQIKKINISESVLEQKPSFIHPPSLDWNKHETQFWATADEIVNLSRSQMYLIYGPEY